MDRVKKRIQIVSALMMISSLFLCFTIAALNVFSQIHIVTLIKHNQLTYYNPAELPLSFLQYLPAVGYAFIAYVFYKIWKELEPFSEKMSIRLKALALVFLLVQLLTSIPYWIMDHMNPFTSIPYEIPQYLLIIFMALAVSAVIYGFALVFQYGALLKKDTDEII